ncbi:alpha/beta hydrolase [Levilactobacillus tongjiangensis]|uniref:Alpha/beta hydrolase n=1 Tax=Levilactobacillus tongjiangensis TaxID=2486023 RepID=A0ABW1SRY2_9LACO|nr:alpha/beta hydrolase [Levilactobacillus tongjiangensis]
MKKRWIGFLGIGLLMLGLSACGVSGGHSTTAKLPNSSKYEPTLFFHGWGSSYRAENQMAHALVNAGITKTIVRATVSKRGKVTLSGQFRAGDYHPIVEVDYQDSRNSSPEQWGRWAKATVVKLQQTYQAKKFNVVGHSMGNMAIMYYLRQNQANLPKLQKQVDIAGHFNGILGINDEPNRMKLRSNGQPEKMQPEYQALLPLRQTYPKNQIDVLNIYGDKDDGSHSDGSVSNALSQSLRYLVASRAKSYQEQKIMGPGAQHSKLHDNVRVDRLLIHFLQN